MRRPCLLLLTCLVLAGCGSGGDDTTTGVKEGSGLAAGETRGPDDHVPADASALEYATCIDLTLEGRVRRLYAELRIDNNFIEVEDGLSRHDAITMIAADVVEFCTTHPDDARPMDALPTRYGPEGGERGGG